MIKESRKSRILYSVAWLAINLVVLYNLIRTEKLLNIGLIGDFTFYFIFAFSYYLFYLPAEIFGVYEQNRKSRAYKILTIVSLIWIIWGIIVITFIFL